MDFTRLQNNMIDVVQEEQVKLGYRKEQISLFYPLASLNRLLDVSLTEQEMADALRTHFCMKDGAGGDHKQVPQFSLLSVEAQNGRFCLTIEAETVAYIHETKKAGGFLREFVEEIGRHGCTIEGLLAIFKKYSDCVRFEKMSNGEFDYLVYFEDGNPDSYRYCITNEGCHMIYHRFTPEDYQDFCF